MQFIFECKDIILLFQEVYISDEEIRELLLQNPVINEIWLNWKKFTAETFMGSTLKPSKKSVMSQISHKKHIYHKFALRIPKWWYKKLALQYLICASILPKKTS